MLYLNATDQAVLTEIKANPRPLLNFHGGPLHVAADAIAEATALDFIGVWTSLKALKRYGYIDANGAIDNPTPIAPLSGVFDVRDLMRGVVRPIEVQTSSQIAPRPLSVATAE